jgi:predicted glycosyltransferase
MAQSLEDARKELDKEFMQVRKNLETVREHFDRVLAAGPEDDVSSLLEELEDTVKKVRTGGLVGSGAKGHREAREKYFEAKGKPV